MSYWGPTRATKGRSTVRAVAGTDGTKGSLLDVVIEDETPAKHSKLVKLSKLPSQVLMFLVFPQFITDNPRVPYRPKSLSSKHGSALGHESRFMALELYCLISASDRVSRAAVSGCFAVYLGALLRACALLSVSVILIGGHHVSVKL